MRLFWSCRAPANCSGEKSQMLCGMGVVVVPRSARSYDEDAAEARTRIIPPWHLVLVAGLAKPLINQLASLLLLHPSGVTTSGGGAGFTRVVSQRLLARHVGTNLRTNHTVNQYFVVLSKVLFPPHRAKISIVPAFTDLLRV